MDYTMRSIRRCLVLNFLIGLTVGVLVNVLSYWLRSDGQIGSGGFIYVGWPFIVWLYEDGYILRELFSWRNLGLNILVWTFAAALFSFYFSRIQHARSIRGLNVCQQCHYDLRGSIGSKTCPECGAAIERETGAAPD